MITRATPRTDGSRRRFMLGMATAAAVVPACASGATETAVSGVAADLGQTSTASAGGPAVPELTSKSELALADRSEVHATYLPKVPPSATRSDQRIFEVDLEVVESVCSIDPANGVTTLTWGYRIAGDRQVTCGAPGPVLRGRVGDVARITLTNLPGNQHPHNVDFHAVTGQGGGAEALTVGPGESATVEVRLLYPGAFMYHCAFAPVVEHIVRGMVGIFIVDPESPLPAADHEWGVVQSEWYVQEPGDNGEAALDAPAIRREDPRYVTFNGRTDALTGDNALTMAVGERARIYMVNAGLNLNSNFHAIGSHWDTVYPEAATHPDNRVIRGSQSTLVVAGGGTVVDLVGWVPSTLILVDHALARTFLKGAIGQIVIEGDADAEIISSGAAGSSDHPDDAPPPAADEVSITANAFDPANADRAYSPQSLTVAGGTTVTWKNDDSVIHTVTSGSSTGSVGTPDGVFDSGNLAPGDTFSHTFDDPGTFDYYCTPHPWMTGTIVVE